MSETAAAVEHWAMSRTDASSLPADWRKWAEEGRGVGFEPEELLGLLNRYDALAHALETLADATRAYRDFPRSTMTPDMVHDALWAADAALRAAGRLP